MRLPVLSAALAVLATAVRGGEPPSHLPGRVRIEVTDHSTGRRLPCSVRLTGPDGRVMRADRTGGDLWTAGRLSLDLPPGRYILQVARGRLWRGFRGPVEIQAGRAVRFPVSVARPPFLDLERRGLVACLLGARPGREGRWIGAPSVERLALAAACEGVDAAAFTGVEARAPAAGGARLLAATAFGGPPHGRVLVLWPEGARPLTEGSNAERMAAARAAGAVSIYVNPGSEAAGALPYDTLAGPAYDAMGIASPEDERVWFGLLDRGYRVPAVGLSGLDLSDGGSLEPGTFLRPKGEATPRSLLSALREGRCMVSQGPLVFLRINDHRPGDRLRVSKERLRGFVEACASIREGEYIASLELVLNGKVVKRLKGGPRVLRMEDTIDLPPETGWILARCETLPIPVGPNAPGGATVAGSGDREERGTVVRRAWTNPIWLDSPARIQPPQQHKAKVVLRVRDRRTGRPVTARVEVSAPGRESARHEAAGGRCEFPLSLTGRVRVSAPGYRTFEESAYELTGGAARAQALAKGGETGRELVRPGTFSGLAFALSRVEREIGLEREDGGPTGNEKVDDSPPVE